MKATVDLILWDSERKLRLPAGTRSMLFRFTGETRVFGAYALDLNGVDFATGTKHEGVSLEFWAVEEARRVVVPGIEFVVWYGGDIGQGRVTSVP